ncbi:MAG: type 4a pilus biogenesis protein PilO [Geopsychrobacter sp.]|nr:type 4a pilus biogenesis protein PilO [Geopsychrobacter sp.]
MSREQLIQTLWGENKGKLLVLLSAILLIVALQCGFMFWLGPTLETTRAQLQQAQTDLRYTQQRVAEGGGAKFSGLADDLEQFYQVIPQKSGLGAFIGRLYSYAQKAGLDIAQISYTAKPIKKTRLLSYQLGFGVNGSYAQVKKFIHLLENSPSVLILDRIALRSNQQDGKNVVALQMQLQTFFREGEQ